MVPVSRAAALAHFQRLLTDDLRTYAARRNRVEPDHGHPAVSRLSAALRRRTIHEDELTQTVLTQASSWQSCEKWLQELWWRRYWKGWLEHRPHVWRRWCAAVRWHQQRDRAMAVLPDRLRERIIEVENGRSGVAVMDAFANELRSTGYLHNHARMWFASFWIHVENLPWWWGARFFMEHLIDADPASNTLSWRWVAGRQTPGKTYLVRRSNLQRWCDSDWLARHTEGLERLDDDRVSERLQPEWPDEIEAMDRPAEPCDPPLSQEDWMRDHARLSAKSVLLLHGEECSWENSALDRDDWATVVHLAAARKPSDHPTTHPAAAVDAATDRDVRQRMNARWRDKAVQLAAAPPEAIGDSLKEIIRAYGAGRVVTPAAFTGDLADHLASLRQHLLKDGLDWTTLRRETDTLAIEAAQRGFFPFWKKISRELKLEAK